MYDDVFCSLYFFDVCPSQYMVCPQTFVNLCIFLGTLRAESPSILCSQAIFKGAFFFFSLKKFNLGHEQKRKLATTKEGKGGERENEKDKYGADYSCTNQTDFPLISFIYFLYPIVPSASRNLIESDHLLN